MMTQAQTESINQDTYLNIIKLARQYQEEGLFNQAEDFYKQAIAMARNLLAGNDDRQRLLLIEALSELASFYSFHGKDERSQYLWSEILELGKSSFDAGDNIYVESVFGLANIKEKRGEIIQAEDLYQSILQKQEKAYGAEALEICPAIKKTAAFYFRRQDYAQAEAFYLRALALEEFHLGTCSEQINSTVDALVNIFRKQKKWRLAEYMLDRQKDILNILHGEGSLCATSCELRQAELFWQSGQTDKAMRSYGTVLNMYTKMFGARSGAILSFKKKLGALLPASLSFAPEDTSAPTKEKQIVMPIAPPVLVTV